MKKNIFFRNKRVEEPLRKTGKEEIRVYFIYIRQLIKKSKAKKWKDIVNKCDEQKTVINGRH